MANFAQSVCDSIASLEAKTVRLERYRTVRENHLASIDWSAMTARQRQNMAQMDEDLDFMLAEIHLELVHLYTVLSLDWRWEVEG